MIQTKELKSGDVIVNVLFHSQFIVEKMFENSLATTNDTGGISMISGDTFDYYLTLDEYKDQFPEYLL